MRFSLRSKLSLLLSLVAIATVVGGFMLAGAWGGHASSAHAANASFATHGSLDCNGYSKIQKPLRSHDVCTDFQGYDGSRGYDNGHYVGHDEPTVQFVSSS